MDTNNFILDPIRWTSRVGVDLIRDMRSIKYMYYTIRGCLVSLTGKAVSKFVVEHIMISDVLLFEQKYLVCRC